ncbi:MAG: hypothetical protein AB9873_00650 [Syntrophobacteraceae bacterium]
MSMGRAANRAVSDDIWGLLTANAAMGDGVAIFHSTHKNLGAQGALSETTLTELRKLMRLQTGMNGALLNIRTHRQTTYSIVAVRIGDPAST